MKISSNAVSGIVVTLFTSVKKPDRNIDLMVAIDYHSIEALTKTQFLVRYAPRKEISLSVDLVISRGNLLMMEGNMSLTIPSSRSMSVNASIVEHQFNAFHLNFFGVWFSGHNMSVKGVYLDESTIVTNNHSIQMKMISPSFNSDISLKGRVFVNMDTLSLGE
ncbi:hypothetical protein QAD02_007172 [Eretmocerus hayati]|uniref:Uncharacterized protein n=1 Tax=Eretmocerus hayati TaxID=131215 RepID=A0ACC2N2W6_9HYME|nr:hypothetical protein QAD02_007172 [Eretmocerus hayati]